MEVFLGSSRESLEQLRTVASWLEEAGHKPRAWDDPELFLPGENTFEKLIQITKEVQAAVFIFGEDDQIWYRRDALNAPRDNVLVEYGLFSGALGQRHVIVCRVGASKMPTDASGITYVDLSMAVRARISILAWARTIGAASETAVPRDTPFAMERALLRRDLEETRERLAFEAQTVRELQRLATNAGIADFRSYDGPEGLWKLLFDYDYFWGLTGLIESFVDSPTEVRAYLWRLGLHRLVSHINWEQEANLYRTRFYLAKVLRLMRATSMHDGAAELQAMVAGESVWPKLRDKAAALADERRAAVHAQRATDDGD